MNLLEIPNKVGPKPSVRSLHRRPRNSLPFAELLVFRSDHIPNHDRAVIRAVYSEGKPLTEVARLLGQSTRIVSARVKRIVARLRSPAFVLVVSRRAAWPTGFRLVAEDTVLAGRSLREIARTRGLSYHVVRRHYGALTAMLAALPPTRAEEA